MPSANEFLIGCGKGAGNGDIVCHSAVFTLDQFRPDGMLRSSSSSCFEGKNLVMKHSV